MDLIAGRIKSVFYACKSFHTHHRPASRIQVHTINFIPVCIKFGFPACVALRHLHRFAIRAQEELLNYIPLSIIFAEQARIALRLHQRLSIRAQIHAPDLSARSIEFPLENSISIVVQRKFSIRSVSAQARSIAVFIIFNGCAGIALIQGGCSVHTEIFPAHLPVGGIIFHAERGITICRRH